MRERTGIPIALFDLAVLNHWGDKDFGYEVDIEEAKRLYHFCAEECGYPTGYYALGVMYDHGWDGTEKPDLKKALSYHLRALELKMEASREHIKRMRAENEGEG